MKRGFLLKAAEKKNTAQRRKASDQKEASASGSKKTEDTRQNIIHEIKLPADRKVPPQFRVPSREDTNLPAVNVLLKTIPFPDDGDGTTEWIINHINIDRLEFMKTQGYPTRIPKPDRPNLCEVRSTPDMGEGVFAKYDIKQGELIHSERPLLISPSWLGNINMNVTRRTNMEQVQRVTEFEFENVLEAAVGRMDEKNKASFMSLHNSHKTDGTLPLRGIIRTNGFRAIEIFRDGYMTYSAICNLGSRFNHRCLSNVEAKFKISSFSSQFVASKNIKAGEQLFVCYTRSDRTKAERQTELVPYGFSCNCPACVNATPATDELRKTYVSQSKHHVEMLKGPQCTIDVLIAAQLFEKKMIAEGLDGTIEFLGLMDSILAALMKFGRPEFGEYGLRWDGYVKYHENLKAFSVSFW